MLEIVRLYDEQSQVDLVRTLMDYAVHGAGFEQAVWDGRANGGSLAPPGRYAAHVRAYSLRRLVRHSDAVAWVTVTD
jgi:flagellar hook assembly protein FlgD